MNNGSFFGRFFSRVTGAAVALALVASSSAALAKARVVAILPLDAGSSTKAAAEHYTDSIVSRLASYPGYDAVRLSPGQEPQESAAKIGAEVYVVGEFDKHGDVLTVSFESFSVTTNQFLGNLVVTATDLDVPGKIDFTPLFSKTAATVPTPVAAQSFDPLAMQSAATPPASLEASPEPSATPAPKITAASPAPAKAKGASSQPQPKNATVPQQKKPAQDRTSKPPSKPVPHPTPRPTTKPRAKQSNRNKIVSMSDVLAPKPHPPTPSVHVKPKAATVAPTSTATPDATPTPSPTLSPSPLPTPTPSPSVAPVVAPTAASNARAFTLIPLQSPDADPAAKRDPLADQSTFDLSRRLVASRYAISIGPTKDRDEASRDAASLCHDSNSSGILVGTMKYDVKKAGLNRLINKNATDAITRVDIRLTLLDCTGKFVWKGQSVKNLSDVPKPASGEADAVEAAITELVALFETRT